MKKPPKPNLEVVYLPTDSLRADPRNARVHPQSQMEQLIASVRDYGITKPILIRAGGMIGAGHGIWQAAQALKMAEVPTITLALSEKQWRAYAIADNRLPLNATWDLGILGEELAALQLEGMDLEALGFAPLELGELGLAGYGVDRETRAELVPEPPKVPVVALGELWSLGRHRLLIGDATSKEAVERLLSVGAPPVLLVSDPPYGVEYDPNWRAAIHGQNVRQSGKVQNDDRADWRQAWALFPGDVAYVWHDGRFASTVQASLESQGFEIRSQIIWVKDRLALSRGDYHWQHESCFYAVRKGKPGRWQGGRKQSTTWRITDVSNRRLARAITELVNEQGTESTVWEIAMTVDDGATGHGTQKPVACMRRPIINSSRPFDGVYDPFCGSFTTGIAAEMEGRRCYAMEVDPVYAEVSIERWQNFTGKLAKREDGVTLEELRRPARRKSHPRAPKGAQPE